MKRRRVPRSSAAKGNDSVSDREDEEAKREDEEAKRDAASSHDREAAVRSEDQALDGVPAPRKLGLSFILNERVPLGTSPPDEAQRVARWSPRVAGTTVAGGAAAERDAPLARTRQLERRCSLDGADHHDETEDKKTKQSSPSARNAAQAAAPRASASKKRGRTCKTEGCDNYIVHKGLCCRHGGGKKCSVDGCESSAKHGGRCWKHGGSIECKIPECTKKAKARGLCWAHGGGAKCQADACAKVAISNGFCWAHGGGRRCIFDGCQRPAFERTHSFCLRHYDELQDVDYYEV